jgi:hypothetical protein
MNKVLLAIIIGTALILGGCNQQEEAQVDPQPTEETTEAAVEEITTEEVASVEQEAPEASATPSQVLPATRPPQEPASPPEPVQEPLQPAELVQPFDNNPQDTGVPCSQWTCRDEQGRSQAEIQHEWMMRPGTLVPGTNVPRGQAMTPAGQDLARQMAGTAPCTSVQCKRGY